MFFNLDKITWKCMVCRDMRPDRFISVAHRHLKGFEGRFPEIRVNVRYCNDRPECIETATRTGVWPEPSRPEEGS